jgi:hypothetical protein
VETDSEEELMAAPAYFDEKRYSYHVLTPGISWITDYQQAEPATGFEVQVQQQYASAFDSLKRGQYARALSAFKQLHNLILTTVDPTLPVTSYQNPKFVPPLDVGLIDVFAAKSGAVLQNQPLPGYSFPSAVVGQVAAIPTGVSANLAPFKTAGLALSTARTQAAASIDQANAAAGAGDWKTAARVFAGALHDVPETSLGLRAALMQDQALATEKAGGDAHSAIGMAQSSANLFGNAKLFDAQVEALTTLAGMQARSGDSTGSSKSLADASQVRSQQRLFPVTIPSGSNTITHARTAPLERAALLTAPSQPRLMSQAFLETLPPVRTYTLLGAKTSASLALTGNAAADVRGFLQSITDSVDISLLLRAVSVINSIQTVAYLPSLYFYVIPMAIGDCLMGLGNLEQAASTYASVLVYPYINKAFEIPKLWNKLAAVYLAMGDRDYRNAADDLARFAVAKADYEHIITTENALASNSPLWADARFAGIKSRVAAFISASFPANHSDNPELLSKVAEARLRLQQIKAGIDFFGLAVNYLPPFSWEYLQNTAKYFAQQASQMEQKYIQYTSAGENETLQRQQLDQQAGVAAQTVVLEQRGLDEANASVDVANASLNYANVQVTNAQNAQADFANNRAAAAEYDELEAWANASAVDRDQEVKLTISGYTYYNTSDTRRNVVIQQLESAREKISQDTEALNLQSNVDAAQAYAAQSQAQVAAAQTQVAIAKQRIALAQLQERDAQENRDYLDMEEFNAQLWFELAGNARRISQRYTDMATAVALLAERAYNAETGRNLKVIRGDYTHSATDNLMGADFLALDLDTFTYDYVTTTKTKKAPVKRVISLADNFPYAFSQIRSTGKCSFQTQLALFDRQTPGMYLCKIRNVELVFVGVTQISVAGTLRNLGASRFRQSDGTVVTRLYPADVMPLSAYELRQDALAFRVNPNDLQLFENNGIDTLWQLDMPLSANDIDFSSIIDVQLVLYYDGFFDPDLETKIKANLPKSSKATRVTSMQLTFPDELFFLKSQGQAQLTYDATLFPMTQKNLKRTKSSLRVTGDLATTKGLTLRVTSAVTTKTYTVKTDASGIVAGAAAADPLSQLNGQPVFDTLSIAILPADNPALVKGGKLNLNGLVDLLTYFEYTFDYR